MEETGLVAQGDEVTSENQDAESWSRLEPEICDMILEKLPHLERLRLRVVCKEWNCSALQRLEPKPYHVFIAKRQYEMGREYIGLFKYDVVSKSLYIENLVTINSHTPYRAVDGLIFCEHPEDKEEWCVYNIHTRTKHVVPPVPGSGEYISGMMVDTSVKPYTFKLVVSDRSGEETQIYNSASNSWSLHPNSDPHSNSSVQPHENDCLFLTLCHKGSMYMSSRYAGGRVFVYSMQEDQWTVVSGFPLRGNDGRPYLGVWDDRLFAVVHEVHGVGVGTVFVYELVDGTAREWVEYARCPKAQYEQLNQRASYFSSYECEFVSVFSEEYVLMRNWHDCQSSGLVLLNLKSREWESYIVEKDEIFGDYDWPQTLCPVGTGPLATRTHTSFTSIPY